MNRAAAQPAPHTGDPVADPGGDGRGRVVLVGAGPGAPGLLTLAALDALAGADVILYDRLAGPAFRAYVRPSTELVDVGKRPGASAATQQEICRRLVDEARAGRTVLRVKGGDPFVFGRGYEEVLACVEAGVDVRVVPGISSALAAPELAGVPLTHRGFAPGFMVVSGHEDPHKSRPGIDWAAVAGLGVPIVVLMGVATIPAHARVLVEAGMDLATPVVAVERATTPRQRSVHATLADCATVFAAEGVESPAVIVIGANAGLATGWGDAAVGASLGGTDDLMRPLSGWKVAIESAGDVGAAVGIAAALGASGAEVVATGVDPDRLDAVVLTSAAAVGAWEAAGSPRAPVIAAPVPHDLVDVVAGPDPAALVAALARHARRRGEPS